MTNDNLTSINLLLDRSGFVQEGELPEDLADGTIFAAD